MVATIPVERDLKVAFWLGLIASVLAICLPPLFLSFLIWTSVGIKKLPRTYTRDPIDAKFGKIYPVWTWFLLSAAWPMTKLARRKALPQQHRYWKAYRPDGLEKVTLMGLLGTIGIITMLVMV